MKIIIITIITILFATLVAIQFGPSPLATKIATSIEQRIKGVEK
jgi:hypothetical protein